MVQPWNIGVCWIDQVFVTKLTCVIFFCSCSVFSIGIYFSPQKRLKHGRQNITLHWSNGIIRDNKCISTKLNAVFILKTLHEQKHITTVNSVTNTWSIQQTPVFHMIHEIWRDTYFDVIEEWRQRYGNGHLEIRKMKIKDANLFNTVGCCI
jgi:hypothetical protein